MPDLSASWDIPNAFGLLSGDFGHDISGYKAALGFLSDLAGGTDEAHALVNNGGSTIQLTDWKKNAKFRRVYAKCQAAGRNERDAMKRREAEAATQEPAQPPGTQRFVRMEDLPAHLASLQPRVIRF